MSVRLEAAAVARALPAVVGKVTSVSKVIALTYRETDMISLCQIG